MNDDIEDKVLFVLGRLEGKIDTLKIQIEDIKKDATSFEGRLRSLERYKSYVGGVYVAIAGIISFAVTLFVK